MLMAPSPSDSASTRIQFEDFYVGETYQVGVGMRPDIRLNEALEGINGQTVEIVGFMDGILPRNGTTFVLLKEPSTSCPFHSVSFDWAGFIPVSLKGSTNFIPGPIRVEGRLDVGSKIDEAGMESYVRIDDAEIHRAALSDQPDENKFHNGWPRYLSKIAP